MRHPNATGPPFPAKPEPQKPGGDASRQEHRRHPHHTASEGEAIWINRV